MGRLHLIHNLLIGAQMANSNCLDMSGGSSGCVPNQKIRYLGMRRKPLFAKHGVRGLSWGSKKTFIFGLFTFFEPALVLGYDPE